MPDLRIAKINKQRKLVQSAREEMVARKTYHTAKLFQQAQRELDVLLAQVRPRLIIGGKA